MMHNRVIGIDYDDVISLDVPAWSNLIAMLHGLGAIIYVVTYRESTRHNDMVLDIPHVKEYIFTNNQAKKRYCDEVAGIRVDIWIDDCPGSIIYDKEELIRYIPK